MLKRPLLVGLAIVTLFSSLYGFLAVEKHRHFGSNACDLAIYDQAVWNISQGNPPQSTVRHVKNLVLEDHFVPIIYLLAVPYRFFPSPVTLLVIQAFFFAFGGLGLFLFSYSKNKNLLLATIITSSFYLFPGFQNAAFFDFHFLSLSSALLPWVIMFLDSGRYIASLPFLILGIFSKETFALYLAWFGLYSLVFKRNIRWGLAFVFAGLGYFHLVTTKIMINYSYLGYYGQGGLVSLIGGAIFHPSQTLKKLIFETAGSAISYEKIKVLIVSVFSAAFLPLVNLKAVFLLILSLLQKNLADSPNAWGLAWHESLELSYILFVGVALALPSLSERLRKIAIATLVTGMVLNNCPRIHPWSGVLVERVQILAKNYQKKEELASIRQGLGLIPRNVSVSAQATLVPHLSQREVIYQFPNGSETVDYIVLSKRLVAWPLSHEELVAQIDRLLTDPQLESVYSANEFFLFKRKMVSPNPSGLDYSTIRSSMPISGF